MLVRLSSCVFRERACLVTYEQVSRVPQRTIIVAKRSTSGVTSRVRATSQWKAAAGDEDAGQVE